MNAGQIKIDATAANDRPVHPVIAVVGEADRAEMHPLVDWIEKLVVPVTRILFVPTVEGAINSFAMGEFPDLVIVLQGWSNEYSTREVSSLLSFAPLARMIVCYGAWCESDGRNHNIWPMSVRVPVWAAQARIEREWQLVQTPEQQTPIPWSASREEVFAADHLPIPKWLESAKVLIDSPDPGYRKFLHEYLIATDHVVVEALPTILLFDADPWGPSRAEALQQLQKRHANLVIVALLNFPEPSLVTELRAAGVTSIVHKLGFRQQPLIEPHPA